MLEQVEADLSRLDSWYVFRIFLSYFEAILKLLLIKAYNLCICHSSYIINKL